MTLIKLSYFNFSGGRGEDCRLALHMAGVEFEDNRIDSKDWPAMKSAAPFGGMPVLEIAGEGVLAQSNAILGLIGSRHGLLPANDFQAARHIAILNAAEDLRARVTRSGDLKDKEEIKNARQELAQGPLQDWANSMEPQIVGPFIAGDQISVADLKLFVLMNWFKKGGVDHIPESCFDGFNKLNALFVAVANHPKVADWYAARKAIAS